MVRKPLRKATRTPRIVLVHGDSILHDQLVAPGTESDVVRRLLVAIRQVERVGSMKNTPSNPAKEHE